MFHRYQDTPWTARKELRRETVYIRTVDTINPLTSLHTDEEKWYGYLAGLAIKFEFPF